MPYEWSQDTPTGPLKNAALSADIREAALAQSVFMRFVNPEPGYGKMKGESITIPRIPNITEPTTGTFDERDGPGVDTFATSSIAITVSYWGRAVEFSEFSQLLTQFDLRDKIQKKLRAQMTLVLDTGAAAAFKAAEIKFIPTSLSNGTFDTDGTASTAASVNLTVAQLQVIRDYMMDTIHVPGWGGGNDYWAALSTKACRGIKRDPDFVESYKYTKGEIPNEIGKVENIRIVEVNHTNALSSGQGTGSVLGEGVVFGDDAVAMAVALDPELRTAVPAKYGTQLGVAWVGVLAFKRIWDSSSDGQARIIHITSS